MNRCITVAALTCGLLAGGCTKQHRITVSGGDLHRGLPELQSGGVAVVRADDSGATTTERIQVTQSLWLDGKKHLVKDLVANCRTVRPFASDAVSDGDCGLVRFRDRRFEVRRFQTRRAQPAIGYAVGGLVLAGTIGAGACQLACDDDSTARPCPQPHCSVQAVSLRPCCCGPQAPAQAGSISGIPAGSRGAGSATIATRDRQTADRSLVWRTESSVLTCGW